MISALSGNSALSLLSMFGRPQPAGGSSQTAQASRPPPPPPPPPSQGNGASAKSIFDALLNGDSASVDDQIGQAVSSLDQDGDGKLSAAEMQAGFEAETVPGDVQGMVANILGNLDTDGDQAVSASELKSGLTQLAANGPPPGGPPGGPSASDAASGVVSALDTDGDGKLSAEELAAAFGSADQASTTQKSLQELLFGLLLDQKDQGQTARAASLYAA